MNKEQGEKMKTKALGGEGFCETDKWKSQIRLEKKEKFPEDNRKGK